MESSSGSPLQYRRNVLTLDGGGVRGLSSLVILQDLMQRVNTAIQKKDGVPRTLAKKLEPQDVFDFAAGTSTGGLIAIMLVKLRMNTQECIQAYKDLSRVVFRKKRPRGRISHGLVQARYSGKRLEECVAKLLRDRGFDVGVEMASDDGDEGIACAVVCREHTEQLKYSELKKGAVPICSLKCHGPVLCRVIEAARATSAAPTYFSFQKIGSRCFSDGGMEYNNPTHAIYEHYIEVDRVKASRGCAGNSQKAAHGTRHAHLDLSRVRFINVGTGDKPGACPARKRDALAENLVPGSIRMAIFLKRTLHEIAVESERVADAMVSIARVSNPDSDLDLMYERFSADNGVCYIKLDKYKEIDKIEAMTRDYLRHETTQRRLQKLGEDIAEDYMQKIGHTTADELASSAGINNPEASTSKPTLQRLKSPGLSVQTGPSMTGSSETGEGATPGSRDPSTHSSAPSAIPAHVKMSNGNFPSDTPLENPKTVTDAT